MACRQVNRAGPVITQNSVVLRMQVADETVAYEYSLDEGKTFAPLGERVKLRFAWWKGARPALFSFYTGAEQAQPGRADFDWLHVDPAAH